MCKKRDDEVRAGPGNREHLLRRRFVVRDSAFLLLRCALLRQIDFDVVVRHFVAKEAEFV